MAVANALAYCDMATIKAVKSFRVQVLGENTSGRFVEKKIQASGVTQIITMTVMNLVALCCAA